MPAKGKHRRTRTQRLTRTLAVAGTGGAALALPLLGAAGAHAAPAQSATAPAAASAQAAQKTTYTVVAGDSLSKIADAQHVSGGWKTLYADNLDAVGDDPSLIRPGLKLTLGGKAAASTDSAESSGASAQTEKTAKAGTTEKAEKTEKTAAATTSTASFVAPVAGGTVGTPYHQSGSMWSSGYHTGTDFVVPTGTPVQAVGAGSVVSAGWGGAYGNQVVIKLADGHYAQYAHLSQISVSSGDAVTAGQQLGLSGATGNVTGPHLHFEIRTTPDYGSDIDPLTYLRSQGATV